MNAEDMNQPVLCRFYRPQVLSKAVPFHTTSSMRTRRRGSPANRAFLRNALKLESLKSTGLRERHNQLLRLLLRAPRNQTLRLTNRQRQNQDRNRLMGQRQWNRHLMEQRE